MAEESGIVLPPGVAPPVESLGGAGEKVAIVNESGLPNEVVQEAVETHFESSSMAWGRGATFQTYAANQGSLLARTEFQTPGNVFQEIKLARELAERDDDIGAVMGSMIATAFEGGMANFRDNEMTVAIFNAMAREMDLDHAFTELYREYLIAGQVSSVSLFTRQRIEFAMDGSGLREELMSVPMLGVLLSEQVRVLDNDMFRTGTLGYLPENEQARRWLDEFFSPRTTPARKAEMQREDPVAATMFVGARDIDANLDPDGSYVGHERIYVLNPRVVHRQTMPKGSWHYPRPPLTRNFALLEAKRLLNILDFALLQGGANFVVVAKKGSDERPAMPQEIRNLREVVRNATRTGVIVGDHRLDFDIITPKLDELLNASKRRLIGRKLAMALLRIPEQGSGEQTAESVRMDTQLLSRVISNDRRELKRHVERHVYEEIARRNRRLVTGRPPKIWFPKIVLEGSQYFTDFVLKLRDRGDIPRRWAVEAAGFDYEAGVQQRAREIARGDDATLVPGSVPHSSPNVGPQDNPAGRPAGGQDDRPTVQLIQTPGETVRAVFDEEAQQVVRVGELTEALLEEYPDYTVGRITQPQRDALDRDEIVQRGSVVAIPVNQGVEVSEERAIRLREGLTAVIGPRAADGAVMVRVLAFREPDFDINEMESAVVRWGWALPAADPPPDPDVD